MKALLISGLLVAFVSAMSIVSFAQVSQEISVSGRLTNSSSGLPLSGSYNFVFKLYDLVNTLLFTSPTQTLGVSNGLFQTTISPSGLSFNQDYFLQLTINSEDLTPRQKITPAPYALYANKAGIADFLGARVVTVSGSTVIVKDSSDNRPAIDFRGSNDATIGAIDAMGDSNDFRFTAGLGRMATIRADGGTLGITVAPSGNVGINTTSPGSTLHVQGNANITGTLSVGSGTTTITGTGVSTGSLSGSSFSCPNCVADAQLADSAVTTAKLANSSVTDAKIAAVDWSKVTSKPTIKDCSASGSCSQLCIGSDCKTSWLAGQCNTVSATTGAVTCASGKSCTIDCQGWIAVSEATATGTNWKCCSQGETFSTCGAHGIKATICS